MERSQKKIVKLKLSMPPQIAFERYFFLQEIKKQEQLRWFEDILCRCDNKDVVPTLEATLKMTAFSQHKITIS